MGIKLTWSFDQMILICEGTLWEQWRWACCLSQVCDAESSIIQELCPSHSSPQVRHSCELVPKPASNALRAVSVPVWGELVMWDTVSALHKQVELLKPILNITQAVIAEVCFMVCLCMKSYLFDKGRPLSHHHAMQDAWRLPVSDTCGIKERVIPGPQSRWETFV